jgi:hypothetical protein
MADVSQAAPRVLSPAPAAEPALRLHDLEEALLEGLSEHLPGLEIQDRALVLSGGGEGRVLRVDLVAIDACGRLVLILLVDGRADETVFAGLETLAQVRGDRALIAQHLSSARLSFEAPPLVVLVAEAYAARVLRSLTAVSPREMRLFEMRELASAAGSRSSFVPVGIAGGDSSREQFLRLVPADLRPTAELCLAEIDRVDSDLESRASFDVVGWHEGRRNLCSLTWTGERILGAVAAGEATFPLRQPADVHPFLDRVVGEHLRRSAPEREERRGRGDDGRGPKSGPGLASGVLLTPEELAAFRD